MPATVRAPEGPAWAVTSQFLPRDASHRGHLQLAAALPEQRLDERQEGRALLDPEELLNIAREVGVEPFRVEAPVVLGREQRRRQAAPEQSGFEAHLELLELRCEHWHQLHLPLPARQTVAELLRRRQRGRARRDDFQCRASGRAFLGLVSAPSGRA